MSFLLWVLGFYLLIGAGMYTFAVVKAKEWTGFWDFSIRDGYIAGWIEYPKWALGWLEFVVKSLKK